MKIWMDGELRERGDATIDVFDHGLLYGDGVFEGIRIYHGRVFQCTAHIDRLYHSADKIRLEIPYGKKDLVEAMNLCIRENGLTDNGYIRLVVTRGIGTLGLHPFFCPRPCVFIIADQIQLYPPELYETGMGVIIAKRPRINPAMLDPSVKSLNYLNNVMAKIEAIDVGLLEAVMLNDQGNVAECTGDNIFLVSDGKLITPPTSAGILIGVTRSIAIKLAGQLGIEVVERDFKPEEMKAADEIFLTGTAAEIMAVTKVDETVIGNGKAGPVTTKLLEAFRAFIETDQAYE
ncbi:MAG: branched-chain-amino-acid transaminase [Planctomycetota bacterium]